MISQIRVSSDYARSITGQVTEVTCYVIGQEQPELTPSKRKKTGAALWLAKHSMGLLWAREGKRAQDSPQRNQSISTVP